MMIGVIALGVLTSPMAASACGCGSWTGPVAASGTSSGGVSWKAMAVRHGPGNFSIEFRYSWNGEEQSDYGFGTGGFPNRSYPLVSGVPGSGIGPEGESDIAGVVSWRTKELVIVMKSGKRIRFKPVAAPLKLRQRWPWIKALRFYDQFFDGSERAVRLLALNAAGDVIARQN